MDSGQKLERKVKKILDDAKGSTCSWKNKQFTLLDWGKPMGQDTGEVKTDFLLMLEEVNSKKIELIKISGKQKNMGAVHNKLTKEWCESIYGSNWKNHISHQVSSIVNEDGFHKDKIINFKKKLITLGFRHEILYEPDSGRERGCKTKAEIYPAVFWGEGCPIKYRHGKIKNLSDTVKQKLSQSDLIEDEIKNIVKDSGIPDFVIKTDEDDVNSVEDILDRLQDIKEFSKGYKDELIDAFFAHNYRMDWKAECKHCKKEYRTIWGDDVNQGKIVGTKSEKCPECGKSGRKNSSSTPIQGLNRSMVIPVKWSIVEGKLDGVLLLDKNHEVSSSEVLLELRNCLSELNLKDDNNFDLELLRGKVTERTYNSLCKSTLE